MKILAIDVDVPFPPVGGGLMRTYQLLRALSIEHEITLVAFTHDRSYQTPPFRCDVIEVPWKWPPLYEAMNHGDESTSREAYHKLSHDVKEPWFVSYFQSEDMKQTLRQETKKGFDLILIEDSDMAQYLPVFPVNVPKVLNFHNVYTLMAYRAIEQEIPERKRYAEFEFHRTLYFEKWAATQCDLCLTCSQHEAEAVRTFLGINHVAVIPNGVDTSFFTPGEEEPEDGYILFTGTMSYEPNVEAVAWFANEVMPLVMKQILNAVLHIVGTDPVKEVLALASENIIVHGRVPDVRPYYKKAKVVIAPILSGGGTRLKILEAAASGKAIVTTSLGVEGLDFKNEEDVIIADTTQVFADSVTKLLKNIELQKALEENVQLPVLRYDWQEIGISFCSLAYDLINDFQKA